MENIQTDDRPKSLIWARRLGWFLLCLHSALCISIAISVLGGNAETDAWWPLLTYAIDFPISLFFTKGGLNELIGIALLAGAWHFYWPQWLVRGCLHFKGTQ